MSTIKVEKPSPEKLKQLKIPSAPKEVDGWSVWECPPSTFDWQYSDTEVAYVYEGKVKVTTADGAVEINKGDLVTFPKGLACQWQVLKKIRKVYRFQ